MATFAPVDWTNAVIVAFLMTLLVGIPLAIYTGVIMARITAYDQARMATCRIISDMTNFAKASNAKAFIEERVKMGRELTMVQGEFVRLRQVYAAAHPNYFMQRIIEAPWGDPPLVAFPLDAQNQDAYKRRMADFISAFTKMIFDQRPDLWALFTPRGYVSSTELMSQPDITRMRRREEVAIREVLENRKKYEK